VPKRQVVPDMTVPHQLARPARLVGWCATADGKLVECDIRAEPGDWHATPGALK
jgi:hypothetical protein